jgi:DNA-binding MltR family transcriptional regulator
VRGFINELVIDNPGAQTWLVTQYFITEVNILTHIITSLEAQLFMDKNIQTNYKVEK